MLALASVRDAVETIAYELNYTPGVLTSGGPIVGGSDHDEPECYVIGTVTIALQSPKSHTCRHHRRRGPPPTLILEQAEQLSLLGVRADDWQATLRDRCLEPVSVRELLVWSGADLRVSRLRLNRRRYSPTEHSPALGVTHAEQGPERGGGFRAPF